MVGPILRFVPTWICGCAKRAHAGCVKPIKDCLPWTWQYLIYSIIFSSLSLYFFLGKYLPFSCSLQLYFYIIEMMRHRFFTVQKRESFIRICSSASPWTCHSTWLRCTVFWNIGTMNSVIICRNYDFRLLSMNLQTWFFS